MQIARRAKHLTISPARTDISKCPYRPFLGLPRTQLTQGAGRGPRPESTHAAADAMARRRRGLIPLTVQLQDGLPGTVASLRAGAPARASHPRPQTALRANLERQAHGAKRGKGTRTKNQSAGPKRSGGCGISDAFCFSTQKPANNFGACAPIGPSLCRAHVFPGFIGLRCAGGSRMV